MATLYIDRTQVKLSLRDASLLVETNEEPGRSVPLTLLDRVVVQANIGVSTALLAQLARRGVGFVVINRRNAAEMARLVGPPGKDAGRRIAQYRRFLDQPWRLEWARRLLQAKLRAQRRFLRRALECRPDLRHPLQAALSTLDQALTQLAEPTAHTRDGLMGLEGAAAAACFRAYAHLYAPALAFAGRNRRPPRDPVNACLSLGYTLCHHQAVTEILAAGLDPYIGFLHETAHGRESLACDLVEILRPTLDFWVWNLFRHRHLRAEHFRRLQDGRCLIGKAGRREFYGRYEHFQRSARARLRRLVAVLLRALLGKPEQEVWHEDLVHPEPQVRVRAD